MLAPVPDICYRELYQTRWRRSVGAVRRCASARLALREQRGSVGVRGGDVLLPGISGDSWRYLRSLARSSLLAAAGACTRCGSANSTCTLSPGRRRRFLSASLPSALCGREDYYLQYHCWRYFCASTPLYLYYLYGGALCDLYCSAFRAAARRLFERSAFAFCFLTRHMTTCRLFSYPHLCRCSTFYRDGATHPVQALYDRRRGYRHGRRQHLVAERDGVCCACCKGAACVTALEAEIACIALLTLRP